MLTPRNKFQWKLNLNQCWLRSIMHICGIRGRWVNSKSCWRCNCNLACVILGIFRIYFLNISCETFLWFMSHKSIDDQSTVVQVMACCLMAPSHYLNQCWPCVIIILYDIISGQWVKSGFMMFCKLVSGLSWPDILWGVIWCVVVNVKYVCARKHVRFLCFVDDC